MTTLDGMAPDKVSTSTRIMANIPQKMSNLPLAKKMRRGHAERKFRPQEPTMPNIIVKIPEGIFGEPARKVLATGIHAAAKAVEQFGDEPMQEFLTWVVIEEVKEGYLFAGGANPLAQFIPVICLLLPAGRRDRRGGPCGHRQAHARGRRQRQARGGPANGRDLSDDVGRAGRRMGRERATLDPA
jgi:hypothetical protein